MAQVTYRGVVYDTEKKTTRNKVTSDLTYRGIKHQEERLVCAKQSDRGGLPPLFYKYNIKIMDRQNLKKLLGELKTVMVEIESEIYSDPEAYTSKVGALPDGCYSIDDDDGYPDQKLVYSTLTFFSVCD